MYEFGVYLEHLMDDIVNTYSFDKWKIPIVENVDNFIDDPCYHTISFIVDKEKLEIIMHGSGISKEEFEKLSTIAWTTKIDKQSREKMTGKLGYYGWGLKATMIVAEFVEIMTKCNSYQRGQRWFWKEKRPYYAFEEYLSNNSEENHTKLIYHLKDEYKEKINERGIIETLQEFYPTLINGAPANGKRRKFLVNGKAVPPPEWLDEKKYKYIELIKNLKNAGGRIFISNNKLEDDLCGIAIIIYGRKLEKRIDPFPDIRRYTGYVHADFLSELLYGDKTDIKKNDPLYLNFKKALIAELQNILKRYNLIPETTSSERELIKEIYNKVIRRVFEEIPKLEELVGGQEKTRTIYMKGNDIPISKTYGPSSKTDIPYKDHEKNVDQPGGGKNDYILKPLPEGREYAKRAQGFRKGLPPFVVIPFNSPEIEAEVQGARVAINKNHPLYQFVKDGRSLRYHICRAGFEAILDYCLNEGSIEVEEYLNLKNQVMLILGEKL
jgi:hypothetical protein